MPRRSALALLLLAAASGVAAGEVPKRTLPELVAMAREQAPQVLLARADLGVRQSQKREALAAWAPSGDFSFYLTGAPAIECRSPDGGSDKSLRLRECVRTVDPGNGTGITFLNFNLAGPAMMAQVNLVQPLYTFGKIENATRAAGHGIASAEAQVESARREAELLVTRAYWGLKAARTALATVEDGRAELEPWLKKIEDDLDQPKPQFTLNDLQRLKVGLAQVDLLIADLRRNVDVARSGLRTMVGQEVEVDDEELEAVPLIDRPLSYYAEGLRLHRPELRALDEGVSAYRHLASWKRAELLPDLALVGMLSYRYAPTVDQPENAFLTQSNGLGFGAVIALRQPLDLVSRWARLRKAEAEAEVLSAQRLAAQGAFGHEVAQAHADLTEARRRAEVAERGQKSARGWLTAIQQSLDLGTGEPRDLIEAARNYFELRLRYYQAIHDLNLAVARLTRATGMEVPRP